MGTRLRLPAAALVAIATGCAGDTAIVLAIHGDDAAAQRAVTLDLYVGVGRADAPPASSGSVVEPVWWRQAPVELGDAPLAFPGGLGDATFDLALTPSDALPLGDELVYAVAARDGAGALVAFAHADQPLAFGEGQIRRVAVALRAVRAGGVTATGCAWWRAEPTDPVPGWAKDRAIVPVGDADCDDFRAPAPGEAVDCNPAVDCDDRDPATNPGREPECSDDDVDCCSTRLPDLRNDDGDAFRVCDGDCKDSGKVRDVFGGEVEAVDIYPGKVDTTCNGVDEGCAVSAGGACDPAPLDLDGDDYITCTSPDGSEVAAVKRTGCVRFPDQSDCLEEGTVTDDAGITHAAADLHPEAADVVCDGVDQDCTGTCDDAGGDEDADGDGFDRCPASREVDQGPVSCSPSSSPVDCDDGAPFAQPEPIVEACDGIDSACDGIAMAMNTNLGVCLTTVSTSPGTSVCVVGQRSCAERFDGVPRFACEAMVTGTVGLPLRLCNPCPSGADPIDCEDGRFRTCHPRTPTGSPGLACSEPAPQVAPLRACGALSCDWAIAGGGVIDGWTVSLVPAATGGGLGGPMLTGPVAFLRVGTVGASPRSFVVRRRELGVDGWEVVRLVPDTSGTCAVMECDDPTSGLR
jgi:hypothetical protein